MQLVPLHQGEGRGQAGGARGASDEPLKISSPVAAAAAAVATSHVKYRKKEREQKTHKSCGFRRQTSRRDAASGSSEASRTSARPVPPEYHSQASSNIQRLYSRLHPNPQPIHPKPHSIHPNPHPIHPSPHSIHPNSHTRSTQTLTESTQTPGQSTQTSGSGASDRAVARRGFWRRRRRRRSSV
jgi:hypothetical protein